MRKLAMREKLCLERRLFVSEKLVAFCKAIVLKWMNKLKGQKDQTSLSGFLVGMINFCKMVKF